MFYYKRKGGREKMDLSEKAIDLLKNNEIARGIVEKLLKAQYHRYTYVEGNDAKIGTGGVLRFDRPDKEVHSIADELCAEGILESQIAVTLPVYYLKGEKIITHEVAAPRNEELRKTLAEYFK